MLSRLIKTLVERLMKASERLFRVDCWGIAEWQYGFGWWDEAFEIYIGKRIIRFCPDEADFR